MRRWFVRKSTCTRSVCRWAATFSGNTHSVSDHEIQSTMKINKKYEEIKWKFVKRWRIDTICTWFSWIYVYEQLSLVSIVIVRACCAPLRARYWFPLPAANTVACVTFKRCSTWPTAADIVSTDVSAPLFLPTSWMCAAPKKTRIYITVIYGLRSELGLGCKVGCGGSCRIVTWRMGHGQNNTFFWYDPDSSWESAQITSWGTWSSIA